MGFHFTGEIGELIYCWRAISLKLQITVQIARDVFGGQSYVGQVMNSHRSFIPNTLGQQRMEESLDLVLFV